MKNILLITTSLVCLCYGTLCAQPGIVPVHGRISFKKSFMINDEAGFRAYAATFGRYLLAGIAAEGETVNPKGADFVQDEEAFLDFVRSTYSTVTTYAEVHEFGDSVIRSYRTRDGAMISDYMLIHKDRSTYDMQARIDTSFVYIREEPYVYIRYDTVHIEEYRDEVRDILGYPCFRVTLHTIEPEEEGFMAYQEMNKELRPYTEYWVTERIRSLYHPVCRDREILERYYPLEINEYPEHSRSAVTRYTVDTIDIR